MSRIPTIYVGTWKGNIPIANRLCTLCKSSWESADHIFTGCAVTAVVWENISWWCKIPHIFAFSVRDLLDISDFVDLEASEKDIIHGIIIIACWRIWKTRNERLYGGKEVKIGEIIGDIKSLWLLWFKNWSKCNDVDWFVWCNFKLK